jgi:hypothetical protein
MEVETELSENIPEIQGTREYTSSHHSSKYLKKGQYGQKKKR